MVSARPPAEVPETDGAPAPTDPAAGPLTNAYRPIRRLGPPQAPLEGVLAAAGERRVVLADTVASADRVFVGRAHPPQHLLAPMDLVRRHDGHDFELPWCREPVARLLDVRTAGSRPLGGGELVTLVVSLLRGTREAWEDVAPETEPVAGRWWLDDDGRPLFAPAEDGGPVAGEASALLGQAVGHTKDRVLLRLIEEARDALQRPRRLRRALEPLEDALFEACAPRPIERMGDRSPGRTTTAADDAPDVAGADAPGSAGFVGLIERFTDAGFAETMGDAVDRTRTAARRALAGGRRLPMLAGAAAAAAVIAVGLLWPSESEPADAHARDIAKPSPTATSPSPTAAPSRPATPAPTPSGSPGPEDAQTAAVRLVGAVAECAAHGDPLCAGVRDETAEPLPDAALRLAATAEPVLLDDYGDVAVVRLEDPSRTSEVVLLQLVRPAETWLLRSAQALPGSG
ncbi:hypothetical protein [Microbacterium sp. JZ31]|uniref:hypothetical protein n=1 Tax=Microbacterium sp. JZ31 TaxID=1906274 RepID=UPI0019328E07|nr:hypothetical protein [Microbacterium sp. JZ31]